MFSCLLHLRLVVGGVGVQVTLAGVSGSRSVVRTYTSGLCFWKHKKDHCTRSKSARVFVCFDELMRNDGGQSRAGASRVALVVQHCGEQNREDNAANAPRRF